MSRVPAAKRNSVTPGSSTKKRKQSAGKTSLHTDVNLSHSSLLRPSEVAEKEGFAEAQINLSHYKTTEYLISQHNAVVDDMRRDNAMLRQENEMLK